MSWETVKKPAAPAAGKGPGRLSPRCPRPCPHAHLGAPRLAWPACAGRRRSWRKVLPGRTKCCCRRGCHWGRWSRSGATGSAGSRWPWCGWPWRAFLATATSAHGSCLGRRESGVTHAGRGSPDSPRSWDHQKVSSGSSSHPKMHPGLRQWGRREGEPGLNIWREDPQLPAGAWSKILSPCSPSHPKMHPELRQWGRREAEPGLNKWREDPQLPPGAWSKNFSPCSPSHPTAQAMGGACPSTPQPH